MGLKMKVFGTVIVFVCMSASQVFAMPNLNMPGSWDKIIGGTPVSNQDPIASTTVGLLAAMDGGTAICTASILANDLAVTAGHCADGATKLKLVFKTNFESSVGTSVTVTRAAVHPQYSSSANDEDLYDIALLYFKGGLPAGYKAAQLLPSSQALQAGEEVTLAGYGITEGTPAENDPAGSGILRQVQVNIDQPNYGKTEVLMDQSHGKAACHGDSGGPAFVRINGKNLLFGITSRGLMSEPNDCAHHVVYTKISAFSSWITQTAAKLRSN